MEGEAQGTKNQEHGGKGEYTMKWEGEQADQISPTSKTSSLPWPSAKTSPRSKTNTAREKLARLRLSTL